MLFTSQLFLAAFLPLVLGAYYACAGWRPGRQMVLVGASLAFYGAWNWRFVPLLAGLTLVNWLVARAYGIRGWQGWPSLGIGLNLAVLAVFKYANFIGANVAGLFGAGFRPWAIVLPLGISFFVFQKISYLADLRRGGPDYRREHVYGLLDFFEFVTFFPQLIAGPLVRHNEIIPQFARDPRQGAAENLARGAMLFVIGLAKKSGIADSIAPVADQLFAQAAAQAHHAGVALSLGQGWAAALTYTLQLYFDFSGYSDMAIGLGLMFGLRLPFNFDAPYRAVSIRDFWRRWHITLSRFLRDYLYIPLGGNRVSAPRQMANVVATMLLGGLWHGAAWTFVAWGGLHGLGLAANHLWGRTGLRLPGPLGWVLTLVFVMTGWVLFRAPDFATARAVFASMLGLHGTAPFHLREAPVVVLACAAAVLGPTSQSAALVRLRPHPALAGFAAVVLVLLFFLAGGRIPHDFIYFQF